MRINNNLMAMNAHRQLGINSGNGAKSIEKLSSGYRINRAGDDAAGLAISEKMRGQIRGLNQASRNSQDAISLVQTAEGALNETQAILQRMRELAVQSATDTNVNVDRDALQNEINELATEITRISETTEFNTQKLLTGEFDGTFHIGANKGQNVNLSIGNMSAKALEVVSDVTTLGESGAGVTAVDADIDFNLSGVELTAVAGGAVGAELIADSDGIGDGFAKDITGISAADGVTSDAGGGVVPTLSNGATQNQISISASSDINWNSIDTTATSTISIGKSADRLTVAIDLTDDTGVVDIDDTLGAADVDADGNYTYDAHGISFTISADDFAAMAVDTSVTIDLELAVGSSDTTDVLTASSGVIGTKNSWTTNTVAATGTKASFTDDEISIDYSTLPDGVAGIRLSGNATKLRVELLDDDGGVIASDDNYTIAANTNFTYDNHGVSFTFNVGDATAFEITQDIETYDSKVTVTSTDALKFDITDDNGQVRSIEVSMATGDYSTEQIRDAINDAVNADAGTFASDVASIDADGNLVLESAFAGADSEVTVTAEGGFGAIFDTAGDHGVAAGGDESVTLTLKDGSGATIGTAKTIAPSATSVSFTDADDNNITFTLKGYDSLSGVNVAQAFSASEIAREVSGIDISTQEAADSAIATVNEALESVSAERAKLGAVQNRLEHTIKNLDTSSENLQASESRIRDVDMAKEMMEFTKNNILQQAAQAMLAQANQAPQGVLQLLR